MHLPEMALEEALRHGECALCWLSRKQLLRRVDTLLSEHVTDPQWRQSLREGNGFCAYHAEVLLARGHILSLAIIAEDLLSAISLAHLTKHSSLRWRCQLCEAQSADVMQAEKLLVRLLREEEWRMRYEKSNGVCVPHLRQLLRVSPPEVRDWLIASEARRWQTMRQHLREVIRKHDYRFQNEPWGDEMGSWRRAIHKLYGVFAEEVPNERQSP